MIVFKKSRVILAVLLAAALAAGCAGGRPDPDRVEYKPIWTSAEKPPEWILDEPDDKDGLHYMVGLSTHYAEEVEARKAAYRAVNSKYASFTGVRVSDVHKVARYLETRDSAVKDAAAKEEENTKQQTDALVSRVKAKSWYIEKYNELRGGVLVGKAYKVYLLATIPVDEYDRVQQWRKDIKIIEDEKIKARIKAAETKIQSIESNFSSRMAGAQQLAAQGQLLQALTALAGEVPRLADEHTHVANGDSYLQQHLHRVESLQRELPIKAQALISGLVIDGGRFSTHYVDARIAGQTLQAWVWYRNNASLRPVAGIPVRLVDANGQVVARAFTNGAGRVDFPTAALQTAPYRFELDGGHSTVSRVASTLEVDVAANGSNINVVNACNDVPGATSYAVAQLFSGSAYQSLPASKLFMGPVTYKDTNAGGNFSSYVQRYLKESVSGIAGLKVVEPRKRDVENVKQAVRTRGIAIVQKDKDGAAPTLGDASVQAVIDGAEAALVAQYEVQPDGVLLDLSLKEAGTDVLLAAATARIDRNNIPPGTQLVPPMDVPIRPTQRPSGGELRVEISTHLGNGQTFQEGDVVTYFAHLNQAGYLLLVYEDADGNLLQIFPNRYADSQKFPAGTTIEVPGRRDQFEFEVVAPFGYERVYAFAATRPLSPPSGTRLENGLTLLDCSRDELFTALRTVAKEPGTVYGEASTELTTVPK